MKEYIKDYSKYEHPCEWENKFNISNWGFFIAYDLGKPVGGLTLAYSSVAVNMLANRNDIAVLWDIRVSPEYKNLGIGTKLFNSAIKWAKQRGCIQLHYHIKYSFIVIQEYLIERGYL